MSEVWYGFCQTVIWVEVWPEQAGCAVSFFENNLTFLEQQNPGLAREVRLCPSPPCIQSVMARTGNPVPVVADRALHSTYNPVEEARRLVSSHLTGEPEAIVVLGFGFGYHVEALLERVSAPVFVVERRMDLLRSAMEWRNLERIFASVTFFGNVAPGVLLTNESVFESLLEGKCALLSHDPSVRLASEYYASVCNQLQRGVSPACGERLKVLVVSPLFGGSLPIARYAASGLKEIGCDVLLLDLSPFHQASRYLDESLKDTTVQAPMALMFHRLLCEFTYCKIKQHRPDLVLFLAQAPASAELLKKLQQANVRTAFWFVENYKLFAYWKEIAPFCDHFFTIQQREFFTKLDEALAFNHFYLPLACDPSVHRPETLPPEERARYGSDVSLAGFGYYNRLHMIQGLTDFSLKLWGTGWERAPGLVPFIQNGGAEFDVATMVKIYNATQVNINLHSSTYSTGIEPGGDFVNPRTFELAGCRAFQLADERSELGDLFAIGEEIVTFKDLPTLREGIRYYLDHPSEREEVARRARRRALAEHTYAIRMRQMLEHIYPASVVDRRTSQPASPDIAAKLVGTMPPAHDLRDVLNAFDAEAEVTLPELISEFSKAAGAPSREEITLRWMRNIIAEGQRR